MRNQHAAQPLKLDGSDAAERFFAGCFAEFDSVRECLWVAHVDCEAHWIGLPIRTIITDVTVLGSAGLFLAHHHPGGDPYPSTSDCLATRRVTVVAEALDCRVIDHVIFADPICTSFRDLGLL